jgi:hypothetical protein
LGIVHSDENEWATLKFNANPMTFVVMRENERDDHATVGRAIVLIRIFKAKVLEDGHLAQCRACVLALSS